MSLRYAPVAAIKEWLRDHQNPLLPPWSTAMLEELRLRELEIVAALLPNHGRLLEIGAGTGWQAKQLAERGLDVEAIDVATSSYRTNRVWPVTEYDGARIPFADASFDFVFSSNVLEHIVELDRFQDEIHRVLRPQGMAIHVVPSSAWRFWTNLTYPLRYWGAMARAHGEHASNALSEIWHFSKRRWQQRFERTGWEVREYRQSGIFYTGTLALGPLVSVDRRVELSRFLGSACHVFVLSASS